MRKASSGCANGQLAIMGNRGPAPMGASRRRYRLWPQVTPLKGEEAVSTNRQPPPPPGEGCATASSPPCLRIAQKPRGCGQKLSACLGKVNATEAGTDSSQGATWKTRQYCDCTLDLCPWSHSSLKCSL